MGRKSVFRNVALLALAGVLCAGASAQQSPPPAKVDHKTTKAAPKPAVPDFIPGLEPRAIEILKAASTRLAAAKTMSFTAVVSYESPSRLGPSLVYSTKSEVTLKRPDKLRVITLGDGPPSEFYYDGKIMMALAPAENLVAVADAPPTIDAALEAAYTTAAIYFPFTDVIVADPYKDLADGLKHAFYIGQSIVVAGTTTDMVAYLTGDVFVQAWIGAEDHLPRRLYAIFLNDPLQLRHVLELSNWHMDTAVAAEAFGSPKAAAAKHIAFAAPDAKPSGMKPPPKSQTGKPKSGTTP
jgi:hypothetical protein